MIKLPSDSKKIDLIFSLLIGIYIIYVLIEIFVLSVEVYIIKDIIIFCFISAVYIYHRKTGIRLNLQQKTVFKLADTGTWEFDIKIKKPVFSKEVYILSGLDPEKPEINSESYLNLIIPEDREEVLEYLKDGIKCESFGNFKEYTIIHAGDYKKRIHRMKSDYITPGKPAGIIQDITDWKNIENSLQDNVTKFALLFEKMMDGFVFHKIIYKEEDEKIYFKFTDINPAFGKITGFSIKELLNKNINDLNYKFCAKWRSVCLEVMQSNKTIQFEDFFPEFKKYLSVTAFSFQKGYLVTIISDITDKFVLLHKLKESELRFRNIIESAEAGYFRIGMDGCFINVNDSWLRMHGYSSKEEVIGKHFVITQVTDDVEKAKENVQKLLRAEAIIPGEFARRCKNGDIGYHTFSANSVIDNGLLTGLEGFIIDVTEQKKAQEEHRQLLEQFHQSEKMSAIGQLASGIAHDFNNQLTGIMGYSDLIRAKVRHDEKLSKYTDSMIKSLKRASDLVSKLLAFSHKGRLKAVTLDIHNIIDEVISLLKHSISKRIKIEKNLSEKSLASRGDPSQIQNAILNIALNACDAMSGGGVITFSTEIVYLDSESILKNSIICDPGSYIQISISDTGTGMDNETIKRIFEPFYTTKKKGKGTGMGLAAVYTTIKNHKGSISVNSKVDSGTLFNIFLPHKEIRIENQKEKNDEHIKKQNATILFVDDEDNIRTIASEALKDIGINVILSKSGEEAVKLYRDMWNTINLVILDMVMPGIDGYETFNIMHQINPQIKAFLSSGYNINKEINSSIINDMAGFIPKPYTPEEIKSAIIRTLESDSA